MVPEADPGHWSCLLWQLTGIRQKVEHNHVIAGKKDLWPSAPAMQRARSWFQGDVSSSAFTGTAKVFCDLALLERLLGGRLPDANEKSSVKLETDVCAFLLTMLQMNKKSCNQTVITSRQKFHGGGRCYKQDAITLQDNSP
eukprot:823000-Pelagomonas_calceolata.AAC.6